MASPQSFQIWDNGNKPFVAQIVGKSIKVYKRSAEALSTDELEEKLRREEVDEEILDEVVRHLDIKQYSELVWSCSHWKRIWIGFDERQGYLGNSILVETAELHYTEIGMEIYSFTTDHPILNYFSKMGKNGVPYPVAVTRTSLIFLTSETYVSKKDLNRFGIPYETEEQQAAMTITVNTFNGQEMRERVRQIEDDRYGRKLERIRQVHKLPLDSTRQIPLRDLKNYHLIHDRVT